MFTTLMEFVLDFVLNSVEGLVNIMSSLAYIQYRHMGSQLHQTVKSIWKQNSNEAKQPMENQEISWKLKLNTLRQRAITVYSCSINFLPQTAVSNDIFMNHIQDCFTMHSLSKTDKGSTNQACSDPDLGNVYFQPSFCYFYIDIRPLGVSNKFDRNTNNNFLVGQCLNNVNTHINQNEIPEMPLTKPLNRQRRISESSEDSFICFSNDYEMNDESYNNKKNIEEDEENYTLGNKTAFQILNKSDDNSDCKNFKKVRFNLKREIHVMHTWDFAYREARKGIWQIYARDRVRFQQRIDNINSALEIVLKTEHRQKIYTERFADTKFRHC